MRFRDELVGAFRSQADSGTRRYVLRQLLDLPLAESDEVIEALREEEAQIDSPLAAQATTALGWLTPLKLAAEHGWDPILGRFPHSGSTLTSTNKIRVLAVADARAAIPGPGSIARPPESEAWVAAGSHLLDPCLDPLVKAAEGTDAHHRDLGLRMLSRLLHHRARGALEKLAMADGRAAVALAQTGDPLAEGALLEAIERPGAPRFDLVRLLGHFPGPHTARRVEQALADPDPDVRMAAGLALEGFTEHDPAHLARHVLEKGDERWPLVHVIESLGRSASSDVVPRLIARHDATDDVLVQVTVVLACSNLGGERSVAFFLRLLESAPEPVQAEALECLVLSLHPLKELRDVCVRFLESEYPQLALNAAIVLAKMEPEITTRKVVEWLRSPAKSARLRGAHLMGYLRSENALRLSVKLANADPAPAVRAELLRGIARYAPPEAVPALTASLGQPVPALRARAIQLWARAGESAPDVVSAGLRNLFGQEADPQVQARILELLGQLGDEPALTHVRESLRSGDEVIASGAARALGLAGDATHAARELHERARGAGPGLRARLAVALWALGDMRAVDLARDLLEAGGPSFEAGALALDEISALLPRLPASPRHQELGRALNAHVKTREYERFSVKRLGMATSSIMTRPGIRKRRDVSALELSGSVDAISTSKLKEVDVMAVVRQARSDSRRVETLSGILAPETGGAPRWLRGGPVTAGAPRTPVRAAGALAFLGLVLGAWVAVRSGGRPEVALGRGMAPAQGFVVVGTSGPVTGGPLRAPPAALSGQQLLTAPFVLRTGKDARLTGLIGIVPDDQVLLGPDCTFTVQKLSGDPASGTFTLEAAASGGECLLELAGGSSELQLELPGATLEGRGCRVNVRTKNDLIVLKLTAGQASLKHAGVSTPLEQGRAYRWNPADGFTPPGPGDARPKKKRN